MFRPFTVICAVLAGGSGLFLYTKKHQTTELDQQISKIVADTQHIRQQTAVLQTEWALLNQPDRLSHLAARFETNLKPMDPKQFVRMADLRHHLPAPVIGHDGASQTLANAAPATVAPAATAQLAANATQGGASQGGAILAGAILASTSVSVTGGHEASPEERPVTDTVRRTTPLVVAQTDDASSATPVHPAQSRHADPLELHASEARKIAVAQRETGRNLTVATADSAATPKRATHRAAQPTDALALALSPAPTTSRRTTRVALNDAAPTQRHIASHDDQDALATATRHPAREVQSREPQTRLALGGRPAAPVTTVAAWRPATAPRYVEARATYGGSLLGRPSIGGGLPPPMPISN